MVVENPYQINSKRFHVKYCTFMYYLTIMCILIIQASLRVNFDRNKIESDLMKHNFRVILGDQL